MLISHVGRAGWWSQKHPCLPKSTQGSWKDAAGSQGCVPHSGLGETPLNTPKNFSLGAGFVTPAGAGVCSVCTSSLSFPAGTRQENPPNSSPASFSPLCQPLGALPPCRNTKLEGEKGINCGKKCSTLLRNGEGAIPSHPKLE